MLSNEEEKKQDEVFKRSKADKQILNKATFTSFMGATTAVTKTVEFDESDELDKFAEL